MIILGRIYKPTLNDWIVEYGVPNLSFEGEVHLTTYGALAQALWSKEFDHTKNFSFRFKLQPSAFGSPGGNTATKGLTLIGASDGATKYSLGIDQGNGFTAIFSNEGSATFGEYWLSTKIIEFRNYRGFFFIYLDNFLVKSYPTPLSENLIFRTLIATWDIIDIKYIELI